MQKSKIRNTLVNIGAAALLVVVLYFALFYLIIPLTKAVWSMLASTLQEGYHFFQAVAGQLTQWDHALFLFLGLAIYFAPTILAFAKKQPRKVTILVINLIFGWSVIGWILALIWALPSKESRLRL